MPKGIKISAEEAAKRIRFRQALTEDDQKTLDKKFVTASAQGFFLEETGQQVQAGVYLDKGADPNATDDAGTPALVLAARSNNKTAAQAILKSWGGTQNDMEAALVAFIEHGNAAGVEIIKNYLDAISERFLAAVVEAGKRAKAANRLATAFYANENKARTHLKLAA